MNDETKDIKTPEETSAPIETSAAEAAIPAVSEAPVPASAYAGNGNAVEVAAAAPVIIQSQMPAEAPAAPVVPVDPKQAKADEKARKKAEAKQAKKARKDAEFQARINACPKEYKPVFTSKFFWLFFLSMIPVVGLIFCILASIFSYNRNVKSFERALLLHYAIWIILALIAALVIFFTLGGDTFMNIFDAFGSFFEELAYSFGF